MFATLNAIMLTCTLPDISILQLLITQNAIFAVIVLLSISISDSPILTTAASVDNHQDHSQSHGEQSPNTAAVSTMSQKAYVEALTRRSM